MKDINNITPEIISSAINGNRDAQEKLLILCEDEVYSIALIMTHNQQDAEDITQDVLIKISSKLCTLKQPDQFKSWLRIVIVNTCKDHFRKQSVRFADSYDDENSGIDYSTNQGDYSDLVPEEEYEKKEKDLIILKIISDLPAIYRNIIIMRFYSDFSYQQIANILGINIGTVKSRINTAKKKLKSKIKAYESGHGIVLHSHAVFSQLPVIMSSASQFFTAPEGISVNEAVSSFVTQTASETAGAISSLSALTSSAVSAPVTATISNSLATKISAATAAVSVAACIGIVSLDFSTNSIIDPEDSLSDSSPAAFEKSFDESHTPADPFSEYESIDTEESVDELHEAFDNYIHDTSIIYRTNNYYHTNTIHDASVIHETSVIHQTSTVHDTSVIHDTSIIYDTSVIHETSTVYVYPDPEISLPTNYNTFVNVRSEDENYQFRIFTESNEAMIMKYDGSETEIVMPSYVNYSGKEYPVTRINADLFSIRGYMFGTVVDAEGNESFMPENGIYLTSITLPEHLKEIPDFLCNNIVSLNEIKGGRDVSRLGRYAFSETGFTEMDLSELFPNLLQIDQAVFRDCDKLQSITMPRSYINCDEMDDYSSLNDVTVYYDYDLTEKLYPTGFGKYRVILPGEDAVMPDHPIIRTQGNPMYSELHIELENKNAVIGCKLGNLFLNNAIDNLYLPEGMTVLHDSEFSGDSELHEIQPEETYINNLYIPASVNHISEKAFDNALVRNIILKKNEFDTDTYNSVSKSITASGRYILSREDSGFSYFTDPELVLPEEFEDLE